MIEEKSVAPIPSDLLDLYRKVQNSNPNRGWKWSIPLFRRIANAEADRDALLEAMKISLGSLENLAVLIAGELGVTWADCYGADFEYWDKAVNSARAAIATAEQHKKRELL